MCSPCPSGEGIGPGIKASGVRFLQRWSRAKALDKLWIDTASVPQQYWMRMDGWMIYFLYSATSIYALSALQLLKHELIYRLFFTHTNIHKAAIVGASTISFTPNFHTQWGGRDFYVTSLERPARDSNPCFQSLVTSPLDHCATTPLLTEHNIIPRGFFSPIMRRCKVATRNLAWYWQ